MKANRLLVALVVAVPAVLSSAGVGLAAAPGQTIAMSTSFGPTAVSAGAHFGIVSDGLQTVLAQSGSGSGFSDLSIGMIGHFGAGEECNSIQSGFNSALKDLGINGSYQTSNGQ